MRKGEILHSQLLKLDTQNTLLSIRKSSTQIWNISTHKCYKNTQNTLLSIHKASTKYSIYHPIHAIKISDASTYLFVSVFHE